MSKEHILTLTVVNKAGVLSRLVQVFARRGYNIDSLVVSPEMDSTLSRITIAARGSADGIHQIVEQLSKLVDVIHCTDQSVSKAIVKELLLIKVRVSEAHRAELLQLMDHFRARTVDLTHDSVIIEAVGRSITIDAFIELLQPHGIIEFSRSGKMLMTRGKSITT